MTLLSIASLLGLAMGLVGKLFPSFRVAPDALASAFEIPIEFLFPFGILATAGIWLLRRWGLYLYAAFAVIGYGVNLVLGVHPGFIAPTFSIVFLATAFFYRARMR